MILAYPTRHPRLARGSKRQSCRHIDSKDAQTRFWMPEQVRHDEEGIGGSF
jgi:hypothetical protein